MAAPKVSVSSDEKRRIRVSNSELLDSLNLAVLVTDENFRILGLSNAAKTLLRQSAGGSFSGADSLTGANALEILQQDTGFPQENLPTAPFSKVVRLGTEAWRVDFNQIVGDKGVAIRIEPVSQKLALAEKLNMLIEVTSASAMQVDTNNTMLGLSVDAIDQKLDSVIHASTAVVEKSASLAIAVDGINSAAHDIADRAAQGARLTGEAARSTSEANELIQDLSKTLKAIGNFSRLINRIADQTNLLALNATIEAARAGDAGKGFAVVAQEVKELARQTKKATEEIEQSVATIQDQSGRTIEASNRILENMQNLDTVASSIATSAHETSSMLKDVTARAASSREDMIGVGQRAEEMRQEAREARTMTTSIDEAAKNLSVQVANLMTETRQLFSELGFGA